MTIEQKENKIIEDFELFGDDWEGKYEHLIELGKKYPPMDESLKSDERLIKGCQSRVWLASKFENGKVIFEADSDAAIPKGIVALVAGVLSGHTPTEILDAKLEFIDKIGLKEHLSPTRANGLVSMVKQMKMDALAYQNKN
ncbi:MAG TPA: SufE family protein [Flavobacteriales bacterium]|nr:SufE family protein [Flavobacteriales bacterium]